MAEVDANAYAVTAANAAAGASNSVETQQPGGSGALRQVMVLGDPTTRANMAAVGANGQTYIQGYQPAITTQSGIIATGAQTAVSVVGYNVATVTLRTFTGTTPSITWKVQASDDNTNWIDLQGINNTSGIVATSFTQGAALTAGTAGPSVDFTVGAFTNIRINVTAISGTSATAAFGLGIQSMAYEGSPGIASMPTTANAPTLSNTAGSASSVTLKAANTARKGLTIYNESTAILYVAPAATASVTAYQVQIPANGYWEMPQPVYNGLVTGIWSAANGNARVVEIT